MIEFVDVGFGRSGAGIVFVDGEETQLKCCTSCGNLVLNEDVHRKHHSTPVIG